MTRLVIVTPCYNEEKLLYQSAKAFMETLEVLREKKKVSRDSFILFVNDGSTDSTWEIIQQLHKDTPDTIKGISLGINSGHQNALLAGMMTAKDSCDAVITIDADLQDDLRAIEKMVDAFELGYDIVYGVKTNRDADGKVKRLTAAIFYRLQRKIDIKIVYNHADFRLMSRRALERLFLYEESNLYLRGIIPMLGFPSTIVRDEIHERAAGKTKYTMSKMFGLALNGITSFSIRPIYGVLYLGVGYIFVSLLIGLYVACSLILGTVEPGWSSLMLSVWFVGGSILIALGIIGLYVGKTFMETKRRPKYNIIDDTTKL